MLLIRLLAALPLPLLHALGTLLGWAAYAMSPTYRRHLRENLAQAGYHDAATRRGAVSAAGKAVLELPAIWLRPRTDVLRWVKRIDGEALIDAARAQGRGLVFLTPHHGCFEITAKVAAERFPITALYRPPKLRFVQALIESGRAGPNLRLATPDYAGVRELLGALKRKEAVGVLPDQVPSEGEGAWVDFFGRPAYTMTLAGRLAHRPGSVTLLAFGERLPCGQGYVVHLRPLAMALAGESDARCVNRALEELVRECPQQYLWGYNRYKRPRGAPAPPGAGA
jgi:Kdo2-lipid IVA lauroyltransferase/acyltransferase